MTEQTTAIAARRRTAPIPNPADWTTMREMASALVESRLLPESIKTWQQAVAIWQKGRELGLEPMQAFGSIHVIKGKPTASAELMRALIYRDHGDEALTFKETTAALCTIEYKRRNGPAQTFSFTMEDARAAGLLGNDTWRKYPAAMLRARCTSAIAMAVFPDSIMGLFTPEELGADVQVTESGEVEILEGSVSYPEAERPAAQAEPDSHGEGPAFTDGVVSPAEAHGPESTSRSMEDMQEEVRANLQTIRRKTGEPPASLWRRALEGTYMESALGKGQLTDLDEEELNALLRWSGPESLEPTRP